MPIDIVWCDPVTHELPPHFPQPGADPVAILEAALAEKDEIIAAQYAETKAWQAQLERAKADLVDAGVVVTELRGLISELESKQ